MKHYLLVFSLASTVVLISSQGLRDLCGENEVFRFCGPTANYQPCCPRFFRQNVMPCIPGCRMGCTCRLGYVRNAFNVCVHPSQCFMNRYMGFLAGSSPPSQPGPSFPSFPSFPSNRGPTRWFT